MVAFFASLFCISWFLLALSSVCVKQTSYQVVILCYMLRCQLSCLTSCPEGTNTQSVEQQPLHGCSLIDLALLLIIPSFFMLTISSSSTADYPCF